MALLGCTSPELGPDLASDPPDATDEASPEAATPDPGDDRSGPGDGGPPPSGDPHGPDGEVPACDDGTVQAIDAVVGDQLDAFAQGDYERALEFASEAFRAGVAADDLARIIEEGYPVAADAVAHETGLCVQPSPTTAEVLVEVTAGDGARGDLVYRLIAEEDRWRIAGAVQIGGDGSSDPATTVGLRS